jgi:hypothetical protein
MFEGFRLHVTACCDICPICVQRIKASVYDMHVKDCKTFHDEMSKAIDKALPICIVEEVEIKLPRWMWGEFEYTRE